MPSPSVVLSTITMSHRVKDLLLASEFTSTQHEKATPALDPANNRLPAPLSVLIIGASQGIGAGIAEAYAKAGVTNLLLAARQTSFKKLLAVEQRAREVALSSIATKCLPVSVTDSASVAQLAKAVREEFGHIDVVVLNSGSAGPIGLKVDEDNLEECQNVFNINVMGAFNVAHYFIPLLKESKTAKTFIAVGSYAALTTLENIGGTAYCISKLAQARLMEFLSEQYGEEGVLAVAVHPGGVKTELAETRAPEHYQACKLFLHTVNGLAAEMKTDLTDDVGLCGAFCVWLSQEKRMWLNGRLLSAKWDVDELVGKQSSIEEQDLLKFGFRVGVSSVSGTPWAAMSTVVQTYK
jgi:NAD(P)-dependent dehydrogenase (short-subunit alcohol dehydrogenase family)